MQLDYKTEPFIGKYFLANTILRVIHRTVNSNFITLTM